MSPPSKSLSANCTISYNDDGQLLTITIAPNAVTPYVGYTFTTENYSSGSSHPFSATLLYDDPSTFGGSGKVPYEFRTGSSFAAINIGNPDKSTSQVVVSQHSGILNKILDVHEGQWSVTGSA
ncbi:hypothetical protein OPQ81_005125 [Rhizoctonia solani]|nr:hypothetical protein OPQ81_005122 [Rhizoctonia solani]KAJ1300303.1 hypothetical protein OPQ81_005125 [Rhizoctonia solani]